MNENSKKIPLDLKDLAGAIETSNTSMGALKNKLEAYYHETSSSSVNDPDIKVGSFTSSRSIHALPIPAEKITKERINRKVAYEESAKNITKWRPFVEKNRRADHIDFNKQTTNIASLETSTSTILTSFVPAKDLEHEIKDILESSGFSSNNKNKLDTTSKNNIPTATTENNQLPSSIENIVDMDETKMRIAHLAKLRSITWFNNQKLKHASKIKSKSYHRVKNKEKLKQLLHSTNNANVNQNPTANNDDQLLVELERAKGRLTLKHKKTDKYLRNLLRLQTDSQAASQMKEISLDSFKETFTSNSDEMHKNEQLVQKIMGIEGSEENEIDSDGFFLANETSLAAAPLSVFERLSMKRKNNIESQEEQNDEGNYFEEEINVENYNEIQKEKSNVINVMQSGRIIVQKSIAIDGKKDQNEETSSFAQELSKPKILTDSNLIQNIFTNDQNYHQKTSLSSSKIGIIDLEASAEQHLSNNVSIDFTQQYDLIRRAFAGDNVMEEEFKREKESLIDAELKESLSSTNKKNGHDEISEYLPGWGCWAGCGQREGTSAKKFKEMHTQNLQIQREKIAVKRKDSHLNHVIFNEKSIKKAQNSYMLNQVPFPYENKQQYQRILERPVGREWNTQTTFEQFVKPRILVKAGAMIEAPSKSLLSA